MLGALMAGWLLLRGTPEPPAAPTPIDNRPPVVTPPPVDYGRVIADARTKYQQGDTAAAINGALSVPATAAERPRADALLQEIRTEAATLAAADRRGAETAGKTAELPYKQGVAAEGAAAQLTSASDTARAVEQYQNASELFRQAASAGWSVDQFVREANVELKARRIPRAIELAVQALDREPQNRSALTVLQSIRTSAAAETDAAARRAREAGATDANPAFKTARAADEAARRLTNPRDTTAAVDGLANARSQYDAAADEARRSNVAAQRNRDRAQQLLQLATERLKAGDVTAADAAIQQAEQLDPQTPRLLDARKALESVRGGQTAELQRRQDINRVLGDAARNTSDNDAIQALRAALTKYPGNTELTEAVQQRLKVRDARIADLFKRSQGLPDAAAIALLDEALSYDPSRADVKAERERRSSTTTTTSRERVETDVRNALAAYESAYEARNVDAFLRVASYWTRQQIENEFKTFGTIRVDFRDISIAVNDNGTAAEVTCAITFVREPAGVRARPITDTRNWRLRLTNDGGTWRITTATRQ
jgi:tetratricopeptide (TPR) repeat protein